MKTKVIGNDCILQFTQYKGVGANRTSLDMRNASNIKVFIGYSPDSLKEIDNADIEIGGEHHNIVQVYLHGRDNFFQRAGILQMVIDFDFEIEENKVIPMRATDEGVLRLVRTTDEALQMGIQDTEFDNEIVQSDNIVIIGAYSFCVINEFGAGMLTTNPDIMDEDPTIEGHDKVFSVSAIQQIRDRLLAKIEGIVFTEGEWKAMTQEQQEEQIHNADVAGKMLYVTKD